MLIILFALAIANVRRPEIHKRLMYVVMAALTVPAMARVFIALFAPAGAAGVGPPPTFVSIPPTVVAVLLIVIAMVYDWRTRGRPHAVYVYGAVAVMLSNLLSVYVAGTATWMSTARFLGESRGLEPRTAGCELKNHAFPQPAAALGLAQLIRIGLATQQKATGHVLRGIVAGWTPTSGTGNAVDWRPSATCCPISASARTRRSCERAGRRPVCRAFRG